MVEEIIITIAEHEEEENGNHREVIVQVLRILLVIIMIILRILRIQVTMIIIVIPLSAMLKLIEDNCRWRR